jgi:hypothetical protein
MSEMAIYRQLRRQCHGVRACAYAEVLRIHQRRINKISEQRTAAQIAEAYQRFPRIAVTRAETLKDMAIKNPKAAPMRARNPMS